MTDQELEDLAQSVELRHGEATRPFVSSICRQIDISQRRTKALQNLLREYVLEEEFIEGEDYEQAGTTVVKAVEIDSGDEIPWPGDHQESAEETERLLSKERRVRPAKRIEDSTAKPSSLPEVDKKPDFRGVRASEEKAAIDRFIKLRWPSRAKCPHCNTERVPAKMLGGYRCASCSNEFSYKTGTIFQGSKIPFDKWFEILYLFIDHEGDPSQKKIDELIPDTEMLRILKRLSKLDWSEGQDINSVLQQCIISHR